MKSHHLTSTGLFVAAVVVYFLAEAVLRRTVYYVPQGGTESGRETLLRCLPDVLRNHFREVQEIATLETKIEKSATVGERRQYLYDLSTRVKEGRSLALLWRIVEEDPASLATLDAWARLLPTLPEQERYDRYLAFIGRCDIRTPADKIRVWQTGMNALANATAAVRGPYVRQMAQTRVVSSALADVYERLWSESVGRADPAFTTLADDLRRQCRELRLKEALEKKPPR